MLSNRLISIPTFIKKRLHAAGNCQAYLTILVLSELTLSAQLQTDGHQTADFFNAYALFIFKNCAGIYLPDET